MTYEEKLVALRFFLAGALKYHPQYSYAGSSHINLWKLIAAGNKFPSYYSLDNICGDIFARGYQLVGLPVQMEEYDKIAALFFETPYKLL